MLWEFAAVVEAGVVELIEQGAISGEESFGGVEGAVEVPAGEVAFGGLGEVVVPDAGGGVVEGDALEAVVEADGPAEFAGAGGEECFGEVLPAGEFGGVGGHAV